MPPSTRLRPGRHPPDRGRDRAREVGDGLHDGLEDGDEELSEAGRERRDRGPRLAYLTRERPEHTVGHLLGRAGGAGHLAAKELDRRGAAHDVPGGVADARRELVQDDGHATRGTASEDVGDRRGAPRFGHPLGALGELAEDVDERTHPAARVRDRDALRTELGRDARVCELQHGHVRRGRGLAGLREHALREPHREERIVERCAREACPARDPEEERLELAAGDAEAAHRERHPVGGAARVVRRDVERREHVREEARRRRRRHAGRAREQERRPEELQAVGRVEAFLGERLERARRLLGREAADGGGHLEGGVAEALHLVGREPRARPRPGDGILELRRLNGERGGGADDGDAGPRDGEPDAAELFLRLGEVPGRRLRLLLHAAEGVLDPADDAGGEILRREHEAEAELVQRHGPAPPQPAQSRRCDASSPLQWGRRRRWRRNRETRKELLEGSSRRSSGRSCTTCSSRFPST
jgi:hypothetical protein